MFLGKMKMSSQLATVIMKEMVWISLDKAFLDGDIDVALQSFVVIMDGCLVTINAFSCAGEDLFLFEETVEGDDVQ